MLLLLLGYLLLCAIVGWIGRERAIGFAGFFVLSVLITPLITAFILLISAPRHLRT